MDTPPSHHARTLIGIAVIAGITGDLLLRATPWGLNFTLWGAIILGLIAAASRLTRDALPREARLIALLAAGCLGVLALRDSGALAAGNVLAVLCAGGQIAARTPSLRRQSITRLLWTYLVHVAFSIAGMVMLIGQDLHHAPLPARPLPWAAAVRGTLLALPPLLLFGALLASADARFEYLLKVVLDIDLWNIVSHLMLIGVLTWMAGGILRGRFLGTEVALPRGVRLGAAIVGPVETGILLGSLDVLFLAFVAIQFSYFFGGDAMVLQTPGLTYAEYARRGFFQLLVVVAVALPLLLGAEWITRKDRVSSVALFRTLAGIMLMLLVIILASAAQKLVLYANAYGLTDSRVHAGAVLVWLMCMLVWFALTVLRGERDRFVYGAIVAGYVVLIALSAVDPDALVARVNLQRAAEGREIDTHHVLTLSADAVPVVLAQFETLSPADRDRIAKTYLARYGAPANDWRTWNVARAEAERQVREHHAILQSALLPVATPP